MIGLCAGNTDYVAPLVFGALAAGLSISTLDPSFDTAGIKHVYSLTRPRLMFCDGEVYERARTALDECQLTATKIYTMSNHRDGVPSIMEFFDDDSVDPRDYRYIYGKIDFERVLNCFHFFRVPLLKNGLDQSAFIVCTSGTTGLPKGVCISHATVVVNSFSL